MRLLAKSTILLSFLAFNAQAQTSTRSVKAFSPIGKWRGTFEVKAGLEVPFNFEVTGGKNTEAKVFFINAEEKFEAGKIKILDDSLFIPIDQFDNELAFKINADRTLTGVLRKQDKSGTPIIVKAEQGTARFKEATVKPVADISGTYDIVFKGNNGKDEHAVGLFTQTGNKLRATFLRITGDSRYLDGVIEGNTFYLSSFIGSIPSYYKGTIADSGKLNGEVIFARGNQSFTGTANENAALPDAYSLTYLKTGYSTLDFSFPDLNGNKVSPADAKFKNKVVIVTIGGTWCPNCIDETGFLAPWYKKNKDRGVEVIALEYERQAAPAYVNKTIGRFKQRFDIKYDVLVAGIADKKSVAESLPALNTFLSFPTTIFIDKTGKVTKIHTGFSGPATGKYYDEFVKEFNDEVDELLKK